LIDALPDLIISIIDFLLGAIPTLIEAGVSLFMAIVDALPEIIEGIVEAIPEIINGLLSALLDALPTLIDAGIGLFMAIVEALPQIISGIVDAIPEIVDGLTSALIDSLPLLISSGIDLFMSLVDALPEIIEGIVEVIPQIITAIVDAIIELVPQLITAGADLIKGLWQGIKDMGAWLRGKVSDFFGGVVDDIKDFFGISSPSKVFAEMGKNLGLGMAEGIDVSAKDVKKSMDAMLKIPSLDPVRMSFVAGDDMSLGMGGMSAMGSFAGTRGGVTNIFNIEIVNGFGGGDGDDLGEQLIAAIKDYERTSGPVFVSA